MKKFKILIGKHFELLSVTETDNAMPDHENIYYELGSDMRIPDFILIRAETLAQAREDGISFIRQWRERLEAGS